MIDILLAKKILPKVGILGMAFLRTRECKWKLCTVALASALFGDLLWIEDS